MNYSGFRKKVTLYNGASISYIDTGGNFERTLVFIHGLSTYGLSWKKNIDALSRKYRCIAIDLPGHGESPLYAGPYTLDYFAGCLLGLIGALQVGNVTLVGHSMGAQICINALLQAPAAAKALIVCAPAGFERFSQTEAMLYKNGLQYAALFGDDEHNLKHLIRQSFIRFPEDAGIMLNDLVRMQRATPQAAYRRIAQECVTAMLDEPVYDRLPELAQPTLIIFGMSDALIPNKLIHHLSTEKLAKHVQKRMQHATLEMIPNAGHFVQWEAADKVNSLMDNFLEKL